MKLKIPLMLLALMLVSCSKRMPYVVTDNFDEMQSVVTKSTGKDQNSALGIIKAGYLEFYDNEYSIALTLEEALELGYSAEGYRYLESQLILANQFIAEQVSQWKNDPNIAFFEIKDCTYESPNDHFVNNYYAKSTAEMPSGVIEAPTGGNSTPPVQVYAPHEMKGITGHCFSPVAFLPVHIVTTDFGGGLISKTRVLNGSITVGISASGSIYAR